MFGILGGVSKYGSIVAPVNDCFKKQPFLEGFYEYNNFSICRKLNVKFFDDKIFEENENLFVAIDGIVLNAKQLRNKFGLKNNFKLIEKLFNDDKLKFINSLKGDFSMVLYDKNQKELFIYTNISTSKPIYYYYDKNNEEFFFGSNSHQLACLLKNRGIKLTVNNFSFYSIASFDYIFSDNHFANEIKKLKGGNLIKYKSKMEIINYFNISSFPQIELSENQYLEKIDFLFKEAVKLQFEKDLEYGYSHISTLSGGLDSRMTTLIGQKLGFKTIDTITFSSKGYWEEIIAKKISKAYGLSNFQYKMDNGNYLLNFEYPLSINGGVISYFVASQMLELYSNINFESYGLLHTGQAGDAIIGSTLHNYKRHFKYNYAHPEYSEYYNRLEEGVFEEFKDNDSLEMSKFKNHVYNGTMQGNQYIYPFSESSSPFLDKDLFEFCMRIPLKYRNNHNLYFKWIKKYYPEMGSFYYEKTKKRTLPLSNRYFNFIYHKINKIYLKFNGLKEKNNSLLNFNVWSKSKILKNELDLIFFEKIDLIKDDILRDDLIKQFRNEKFRIKMKAFHAVIVNDMYFN